MQTTGEERVWAFQRAHQRIVESVIADVMLFHMVGYAAVGPDIEFEPTLEANSALRLATIGLK
jgi:peptide/nickel transport system substrate-binding protein